jgi:hypothetical protein
MASRPHPPQSPYNSDSLRNETMDRSNMISLWNW